MVQYFDAPSGRRIAYDFVNSDDSSKKATIVFLGGFMSDMEGSKAIYFQGWAKRKGLSYLRFDYSGHGKSSEQFVNGSIGDWAQDAYEIICEKTTGPLLLIGSSMGGWITFLLYKKLFDRISGLVTIAAAPDFTEDGFWAEFTDTQRQQLEQEGVVYLPSSYDEPYAIGRRLILEGRDNLILRSPLEIKCPLRMVQGTEDSAVSRETALKLLDHITCDDMHLKFVKGGDHSFSSPQCLAVLEAELISLLNEIE